MASIDDTSLLRFVPSGCTDLDFFSRPHFDPLEYDAIAQYMFVASPLHNSRQHHPPLLPHEEDDDSVLLLEDMMKIPGLEEKYECSSHHHSSSSTASASASVITPPLSNVNSLSSSSPASVADDDQQQEQTYLQLTQIASANSALLFQQEELVNHNPLLEMTNPNGTEKRVQPQQDKDATKITKGHWTPEEDRYLKRLVKEFGAQKWSTIARYLPGRNGKQCRERWQNHLRPDIKLDTWSPQEEEVLVRLHKEFGSKWAEISKLMPGRTENSIKNVWNATKRRKGVRRRPSSAVNILRDYILSLEHCSIKVRPTASVNMKTNSNGQQQLTNKKNTTEGYIGPLPSSSSSSSSSSLFANQFSLEGLLGVSSNLHMNNITSVFNSSNSTPASFVGLELGDLPYSYGHINTLKSIFSELNGTIQGDTCYSLSNSHPFRFPSPNQLPHQHVQVNGLSHLIDTVNATSNSHHSLATSSTYIERWLHNPAKFIGDS